MSFENSLSDSMKLAQVLFMDIVSYLKLPTTSIQFPSIKIKANSATP